MAPESGAPIGYLPGSRPRPNRPQEPNHQAPAGESTTSSSPPGAIPDPIDEGAGGLRGRVERLRQAATSRSRPLGSPEGNGARARRTSGRSSPGSIERRSVDSLAIGIRQASKFIDWTIGRRFEDADFVATADEAYSIAAPLAGYLLDRIPEDGSGPIGEALEKAGLIGAVFAGAGYLLRALFRVPGGKAEAEEIHDKLVMRMNRQADKERADVPIAEPNPDRYAAMQGLEL